MKRLTMSAMALALMAGTAAAAGELANTGNIAPGMGRPGL